LLALFIALFLLCNLNIHFCSHLLFLLIMFHFPFIDVLLWPFSIDHVFVDIDLLQHHQLSLAELLFGILLLLVLFGNQNCLLFNL
jgi:hypothetical protein